jgi:hypothetical protein
MTRMHICLTAVVLAATLGGNANAAEPSATSAEERYQSDRVICLTGQSNQSEATCLKEAGAAREEAIRHQLGDGNAPYDANAMRRCATLPPADKRDCESRIRGEGSVSGSVRDGGLIRETTTIVPADPAK